VPLADSQPLPAKVCDSLLSPRAGGRELKITKLVIDWGQWLVVRCCFSELVSEVSLLSPRHISPAGLANVRQLPIEDSILVFVAYKFDKAFQTGSALGHPKDPCWIGSTRSN
jgi:hypothetical protein